MPDELKPTVSVITPLYNKERYFSACIHSVLMQTYQNWEMIVIDDGSTDGSSEMLKFYAKKYPGKIISLYHPNGENRGVSESRQLASAQARGDYLAYLDADDLWMPEKLSHDISKLRDNQDAAAVISRTLYWWDDGSEPARIDHVAPAYDRIFAPGELFKRHFTNGEVELPCTCAVTIRRFVIEKCVWDPTLWIAEDLKFFGDLYSKFTVYASKHCLSEYRRVHDGAWSAGMRDGTEAEVHKRLSEWRSNLGSYKEDGIL